MYVLRWSLNWFLPLAYSDDCFTLITSLCTVLLSVTASWPSLSFGVLRPVCTLFRTRSFEYSLIIPISLKSQGRRLTMSSELCGITRDTWIWGGVVKSLARPGRKQATAAKLGIYSTYSPRNSILFLARCSSFCKPIKKIQKVIRPTRSPRQQWYPRRTKNGDQDFWSPGRSFSSGLQVRGEPGNCRARTRNSRGVFPSKCPSIAPAEMSNTPRW